MKFLKKITGIFALALSLTLLSACAGNGGGASAGGINVEMSIDASGAMEILDEATKELVPEDGMILSKESFDVDEGSTAYDLLNKVCMDREIQLDASFNADWNSYYISGIGYVYENFDVGYGGWVFYVNGEMPEVAASDYVLEGGELVEWSYVIFE